MNLTLIAAVFALVTMATQTMACECQNALTPQELQQFYCSADFVFTGRAVQGRSSIMQNRRGERIQSRTFTYEVEDMYKGTEPSSSRIAVRFTRNRDRDTCTSYNPGCQDASALIFASTRGRFQVQGSCRHAVPWSCVSESLRNSLSDVTC
ncbi:hypothetical protein EGW08_012618 [Elysia chlorotica]|uniref:NTR domain-containing protein n=1 Tax=Elysia chlorotica TaxID=188477 RepID=A0A3S1HHS5_ELYCH|nr:hypothetical protein EGW08_012618 [Elysia chlorotica]